VWTSTNPSSSKKSRSVLASLDRRTRFSIGAEERHSGFIDGSNSSCWVGNLRAKRQEESSCWTKSNRFRIQTGSSRSGWSLGRGSKPYEPGRSDSNRNYRGIGKRVVVDIAAGTAADIVVGTADSRRLIAARELDKSAGRQARLCDDSGRIR
jgi:hypothetical protein